jgi:hypothetical protein
MNYYLLFGTTLGALLIILGFGITKELTAISPAYSQSNSTNIQDSEAIVKANLERFDTLDFDAFSNQNWALLNEIHAPDVFVVWPDGRQTTGIEQHDKDLKEMFVYAPDTKINVHPIKFGSGNWTAVTGFMTGTFSKPMPLANGSMIPPTGKQFNLTMATIAEWNDDGRIAKEYLFWDNAAFMKQIGLSK